jgi:hypothetical protein
MQADFQLGSDPGLRGSRRSEAITQFAAGESRLVTKKQSRFSPTTGSC